MGKILGSLIKFALAFAVLTLLVYNTIETVRLRQDLNRLRFGLPDPAVEEWKTGKPVTNKATKKAPVHAHLDRAKQLLAKKDYDGFRAELQAAADATQEKAGNTLQAVETAKKKFDELQSAIQDLSKQTTTTWKEEMQQVEKDKKGTKK
jgi:hypothetical protein